MYEEFGGLYDALVDDIDYASYGRRILDRLKGETILEIGCGTGNLTEMLLREKTVFAFDTSDVMVSEAWKKLGVRENLSLTCQDFENFQAPICDSAVALLDVINYVTDTDALYRGFVNVRNHIKEGGVFLFDLNTKERYRRMEERSWIYEKDDIFYTWETQRTDTLYSLYLTFFQKEEDGRYKRVDEYQQQRYYAKEYIADLLMKAGFREISFEDLDENGAGEPIVRRLVTACVEQ